jgi:glycosyltransferase involved in cell wall biosynthesis
MRVAILTNILTPYRVPLFDSVAKRSDFDVRVFTTSESQRNRNWDTTPDERAFECEVLRGYSFYSYSFDRALGINPGVVVALRRYDPNVLVVGGYSDVTMWLGLAVAKVTGTPVVPWIGTWHGSNRTSNRVVDALKRTFVQSGSTWLAYGTRAADFLISLGADPAHTHNATNAVDLDWFGAQADQYDPPDSDALQLLYCGQLIPRKNVETVLDALAQGFETPVELTVLGDGPQRERLERLATLRNLSFEFEGYVDREDTPEYYAQTVELIMTSRREVWALVVNEALACGGATLVSEKCGCVPDLLESGFNGQSFDPDDVSSVHDAISWAVENRVELRSRREEIASDVSARASVTEAADAFDAAIRNATGQSP